MKWIADQELYQIILEQINDGVIIVDQNREITYWNGAAEAITGFSSAEVMGSHCYQHLQHITDQGEGVCQDRCPLVQRIRDDRVQEIESYAAHKAGHRVPMLVRALPVKDGAGKVVGAVEIFRDNTERMIALDSISELKRASMLDQLTGVGNRRFGEMTLNSRLENLRLYGINFGVLFIDVDNFKRINDSFGHDIGDEVLKMVSRTLTVNLHGPDALCRWGGEEFLSIVSHLGRPEQLMAAPLSASQKLLALVKHSCLPSGDQSIHVTISIGATMARTDDTADTIVKRADQLMYQSKLKTGNAVTVGT
jgi:diguanylate cyclase (GGDEF)-like protein/PAS domain S-box-containing protein